MQAEIQSSGRKVARGIARDGELCGYDQINITDTHLIEGESTIPNKAGKPEALQEEKFSVDIVGKWLCQLGYMRNVGMIASSQRVHV